MVDDLLNGRVTSFRREQGFGVITLDDGRDVKFDASNCTMIPEEGAAVRLRVGPAKWGGGVKALHVEPRGSSTLAVPHAMLTLDEQVAALLLEVALPRELSWTPAQAAPNGDARTGGAVLGTLHAELPDGRERHLEV